PALRIEDLAGLLRDHLSPKYGLDPVEVRIEEIGMRAGEKVCEELLTDEELERAIETDDMFVVLPQLGSLHGDLDQYVYPGRRRATFGARSDQVSGMTREQLLDLLVAHKVLEPA